MPSEKDQLCPTSEGPNVVFSHRPQLSGVRSGFEDVTAIRTGPFADHPRTAESIAASTIQDALSRILRSSLFIQSDRLGRFLQYTINATLDGEGERLKEYLIGTEVYNRPTSYRPSEDSIVRSEARRLRNKLREYYQSVGKNDSVVIEYRPGSYMPLFRSKQRRGLNVTAKEHAFRFHRRQGIRIAVLPFLDTPGCASCAIYAQLITDELIHELARIDGILVTAASSVAPLVAKAVDVRSLAQELDVQIVFEGTVRQDDNLLRVTSRVVDPANGFQIWSERFDTEPTLQGIPIAVAKVASSLVNHIQA
jgi:TolB-like protein